LRNALIPVVTVIGLQVGVLFTGAHPDRDHFFLARCGQMDDRGDQPARLSRAARRHVAAGGMVMLVNLLVDVTYGIINPRIRH
jgi:dipeptide transport system permease protein